jgi:hypothetical protein
MKRSILFLATLFALTTSGCNLLFKVPIGRPELILTETFSINEATAKGDTISDAEFTIAPSNASLVLAGDANGLVNGDIQYNVADWKPSMVIDENTLYISQAIPDNNIASVPKGALNEWELNLNPTLKNITVFLSSGNYTLKFADTLPDGAVINVHDGVGNLRLEFPANVTVNVEVQRGPANIATEGDWSKNGKSYTSGSSLPVSPRWSSHGGQNPNLETRKPYERSPLFTSLLAQPDRLFAGHDCGRFFCFHLFGAVILHGKRIYPATAYAVVLQDSRR